MAFANLSLKAATGKWTHDEHARFLVGMQMFPNGPWRRVAAIVQTRTVRQLRTHAQKYRAKLARQGQAVVQRSCLPSSDKATTITAPSSPLNFVMEDNLEPHQFADATIQFDECIELLVNAFGDISETFDVLGPLETAPWPSSFEFEVPERAAVRAKVLPMASATFPTESMML
ncbi:hypothetical protein LEN26_009087 [Aphanomyces euteiches]|nr:hypothetical protein AeMF1_008933 [Aphanomyces euteiches]KAH9128561.1 hypothetical protein LEN26_009087 [Aphanomyces euteiches]KAH9159817.1 hypothetical protein AeNC1_019041 [Aphanomyces euteiches]